MKSLPLSIGDRIPAFILPSPSGESKTTGDFVGKPLILFFYSEVGTSNTTTALCSFQAILPELKQLGVNLIGIGTESVEAQSLLIKQYGISFPLLSDMSAQVSKAYGVGGDRLENSSTQSTAYATFVADTNFRIIKIYQDIDPHIHPSQLVDELKELLRTEEPRHIQIQAPVLLIPNVLDPELCRYLIHIWHTEGNGDSGFMRQINGQTVGMFDYSHKIRRDHFMKDGEMKEKIKRILGRRVTPEIWKAFHFNATRLEDLRVVCYDASRGGYFRPHRDNTTAGTAHRRFAMTINLNAGEYEGGYLRFPEHGPHLYRPDTGSAVIFSCSLLHEATDITAGRRFALLSFLYGEQEAQMRQEYIQRTSESSQVSTTAYREMETSGI